MSRFMLSALIGAAAAFLGHGAALGQTPFYQGKTITMIVGYTPGGLYDTTTRMVALCAVRSIRASVPTSSS